MPKDIPAQVLTDLVNAALQQDSIDTYFASIPATEHVGVPNHPKLCPIQRYVARKLTDKIPGFDGVVVVTMSNVVVYYRFVETKVHPPKPVRDFIWEIDTDTQYTEDTEGLTAQQVLDKFTQIKDRATANAPIQPDSTA